MVSLILIYAATAIIVLRMVADIAYSVVTGNKARAAKRAAREAA